MRVSDRGICEIAAHEGIVPYPYRDSVNVWTCGIGHTASAGAPDPAELPKGQPVPLDEVMGIFRRDLATFEARVNDAVKVPLQQHEFDALVSFDFNTGGIYKAKLTEHLNRGDRASAVEAFMGWSKPPEIIPRRTKEQALFRDGTYSSGGRATLYQANAAGKVLWRTGSSVEVMNAIQAAGKPVQPQAPAPAPTTPAAYEVLSVGAESPRVKALQQELKRLNYHPGGIDGIYGNLTRDAVLAFQADNGLGIDGKAGPEVWAAIDSAGPRPLMVQRQNATVDELADKGSEIADASKKGKKGAIATVLAGVGAVGSQVLDHAGHLVNLGPALEPLREPFELYGPYLLGTAIVGLAGFIWFQSKRSGEARLRDHREAKTL